MGMGRSSVSVQLDLSTFCTALAQAALSPLWALINVGGLLYGTTPSYGSNNGGTVFSITTAGYLATLHNFGSGSDGISPFAALLYTQGTLYGTTSEGGAYGKVTVFSMGRSKRTS